MISKLPGLVSIVTNSLFRKSDSQEPSADFIITVSGAEGNDRPAHVDASGAKPDAGGIVLKLNFNPKSRKNAQPEEPKERYGKVHFLTTPWTPVK